MLIVRLGLATHWVSRVLKVRGGLTQEITACGATPPEERRTVNRKRVNCLRCRRTKAWRERAKLDA